MNLGRHHLAYCTNIHRGNSWEETFQALQQKTMAVRDRICPGKPYAIGLRLSHEASLELMEPGVLETFKTWLDSQNAYVFTINGFPYSSFHGTRVKENVFLPDWTSPDRLEYTKRLFTILSELLPPGVSGSVSTLPGSLKEFGTDAEGLKRIFDHLNDLHQHLDTLSQRTGQDLHLGLEPEPMGFIETTGESLKFFGLLYDYMGGDMKIFKSIGLNYDTCHLAIEFEEAKHSLARLRDAGIRLSKLHFSNALKIRPTEVNLKRLEAYQDEVYFHQVIIKDGDNPLRRFRDLPDALNFAQAQSYTPRVLGDEWRIHFHLPLHTKPEGEFETTQDHLLDTMDFLAENPTVCEHLEMETYTWEVLPENLRTQDVVDQLEKEYRWTLAELDKRGLVQDTVTPAP